MISIRKKGEVCQYSFEKSKVNGKRRGNKKRSNYKYREHNQIRSYIWNYKNWIIFT